MIAEYKVFI